ncbi:MAG: Uma2 family endonuclease [Chloroflexi bacterium]|nr:Uma2 family endonuclease [Chloroflexota bacterium]
MAVRRVPASMAPPPGRSRYDGKRMPLAEYLALPEEKPALEYWNGRVVQKAVPHLNHGTAQGYIVELLGPYSRANGGRVATEVHIWFATARIPGFLVPDVIYYAPGRQRLEGDRALPPTLAVEVRSKDETMAAQRQKCRDMRENGVDVCWLIDPETRTAEVFDGNADAAPVPAGGKLESPHLPGFSLPLDELFSVLD